MTDISKILETVYWLLRGQEKKIVINYYDFKTVIIEIAGTRLGLGFNEKALRLFTLDPRYDENSTDHRKFLPTFLITSENGQLMVKLRTKPDTLNEGAATLQAGDIEQISVLSEHLNALNQIMKMIKVQSKVQKLQEEVEADKTKTER